MKQIIKKTWMLMAVLCASLSSYAYDFEVDGIYYSVISLQDLTCEVVKGDNKYEGDVVIPSEVIYNNRTLSVIAIGADAFRYCGTLISVTIPNSVTEIGKYAFGDCLAMTSVTIPNSVTEIAERAFYYCESLSSIKIPDSVTDIGEEAFYNCESLESARIGNGVTKIKIGTFKYCNSLKEVILSNSISKIEKQAFNNCASLSSIKIPDSVIVIGEEAFNGCRSLESVEMGESMVNIMIGAFKDCKSLKSLSIGNSVTEIGKEAFRGCSALTSLIIPNSVTSISSFAFADCINLESIQLSDSLKYITTGTFLNCKQLEKLEIPGSVEHISLYNIGYNGPYDKTFGGCESLRKLSFLNSSQKLIVSNYHYSEGSITWDAYWPETITDLYLDRPFEQDLEMYWAHIEHLELGESIKEVQVDYKKDSLKSIVSYALVPPGLSEMSNTQYMNVQVKVPYEALEVYQQADVWKNFWNLEGFDPNAVDAEMIYLNTDKAELYIGETVQLEATVFPEDTTDKKLEWKSSNDEVAIVDESGLVTAIGEGSAIITVTCGEASAQCEITVLEEDAVEELFVNPDSKISIYSIDGSVIKKDCKALDLRNLDKGIYIIVFGNNRYKISI